MFHFKFLCNIKERKIGHLLNIQELQSQNQLMGSCILKTSNSRTEQLPDKAHKYVEYYEPSNQRISLQSTATNPEELIKKLSDDHSKKRQDFTTAPSEVKPSENPDSFITLSQLLASENQAEKNEIQEMSYHSSIIRLSKRQKRVSQTQQSADKLKARSVIMSQIEKQENLDCNKSEMDDCSRLLIRLQKMDFEFILPKLGAGPLIVPLINYSKYEV